MVKKIHFVEKIGKNGTVSSKLGQKCSKMSQNWEKLVKIGIISILTQKMTKIVIKFNILNDKWFNWKKIGKKEGEAQKLGQSCQKWEKLRNFVKKLVLYALTQKNTLKIIKWG